MRVIIRGVGLGWWRIIALAGLAWLLYEWVRALWAASRRFGLFRSVGVDWAYYYAQATALWSGNPAAIYQFDVLDRQLQHLAAYNTQPDLPLAAGHVPYPPLFAWLFTPFTLPDPPVGFAWWTALNVVAALWLAWRVASQVRPLNRPIAALLLLTSVPVIATISTGQVALLAGCAVAEMYLAFRAGHDGRAGLLLACLLVKPQYAVFIGALLLWKRRWRAAAGATLGAAVVLIGSWLVAGLPALLAYPIVIGEEDPGLRSAFSHPELMINWRAIVLAAAPDIAEGPGLILTAILSVVPLAVTVAAWRGPWDRAASSFGARMSLLVAGILLATYHSHVHGAVLLAVPLAAVFGEAAVRQRTRIGLLIAIIAPGIAPYVARFLPAGTVRGQYAEFVTILPALCILAITAALAIDLLSRRYRHVADVPPPFPRPSQRRAHRIVAVSLASAPAYASLGGREPQ